VTDSGDFQTYYLRRIGVVTPFSVSRTSATTDFAPRRAESVAAMSEMPPSEKNSVHEPVSDYASTSASASSASTVSDTNLQALHEAALQCRDCALAESRTQVVFGVGSEHPDVLFIGEAPGEQEDKLGEPFVGKVGELLDEMLTALNWSRKNVYMMNVVKCRPPENRNPQAEEVQACGRWFDAQLAALKPKVVCLLGKVAAQGVLGSDASLASLRGQWHEYRGVPVLVSYHPAYLLRSPSQKARSWQDFRVLAERCEALRAEAAQG